MLRLWELNTSSADTSGTAKAQAGQRLGLEPDESDAPSSTSSSSARGPWNPSASHAMGACSAIGAEREGHGKRRRTADKELT